MDDQQHQPQWDEGSPCVEPMPVGMRYPPKPAPRCSGYIPDGSGVEWSAWDAGQMEAYARAAYVDGFVAAKKGEAGKELQTAICETLLQLTAANGRLRTERDTVMDTLRVIAEKKRRTKEQRLANSCLMFLEALDVQPNAALTGHRPGESK